MQGLAQDILPGLPNVNAIVIGGTTGDTEKIISLAIERLNSGGRLVVTSILFETIYKTLKKLEDSQLSEIDITQVTIAKSKKTTSGTMMISRNPVVIFSATK
jgi:cobalt-precorrin-6B (C15)-methyltransferase